MKIKPETATYFDTSLRMKPIPRRVQQRDETEIIRPLK
jgi:hypothetical protein